MKISENRVKPSKDILLISNIEKKKTKNKKQEKATRIKNH